METPYTFMLQIFKEGHWHDAMRLEFSEPQQGFDGPCRFHYRQDYLVENLDDIQRAFSNAVSGRFPLEWDISFLKMAPAFLHDIAPAGAAKRFLLKRVGQSKPDNVSMDLFLLGLCTALADLVDPEQAFERLRADADHLRALPDILVANGLPAVTLNHPAIALGKLDQRLQQWGLR
ncbi:hypothetical protein [Pseudomonas gessardii]|nr:MULTISPECIES: hypothetical protein [Pseudomonas]PHN52606.1 hypothetical protein AO268_29170 [Pseudomonas sp. ICMP 8385]